MDGFQLVLSVSVYKSSKQRNRVHVTPEANETQGESTRSLDTQQHIHFLFMKFSMINLNEAISNSSTFYLLLSV